MNIDTYKIHLFLFMRTDEVLDEVINVFEDTGILIIESNNIKKANRALHKMVGLDYPMLLGKTPESIPKLAKLIEIDGEHIVDGETFFIQKFDIDSGEIILIKNITEKKREEVNARVDFTTKVAHELRTPLTVIKGYIEVLKEDVTLTRDERKEILRTIRNECLRLERIIENMLELARIDSYKIKIDKEKVTIDEILQHVKSLFSKRFTEKGIELKFEIENLEELFVDSNLIKQVFINLLDNAFKFTDKGYVKVSGKHKGDHVEFIIEDTGIGIPKDKLDKVFEKFYRVEDKAHTIPGVGLGLAITKEIIELHGGKIWIESEEGKGTKVRFTLPYG